MRMDLIDFNKYDNPIEVSKYELFIGPQGEYYKVKTRYESDENCTHYKWAEAYLEKHGLSGMLENENIHSKCKTPLELLVDYFGFIRYTHAYESSRQVYLTVPNRLKFGYEVTKDQIDSIYKLMYYNHDTIDENIMKKLEDIAEDYEIKREHVFNSIKSKR